MLAKKDIKPVETTIGLIRFINGNDRIKGLQVTNAIANAGLRVR
jgi:hypothetical protein